MSWAGPQSVDKCVEQFAKAFTKIYSLHPDDDVAPLQNLIKTMTEQLRADFYDRNTIVMLAKTAKNNVPSHYHAALVELMRDWPQNIVVNQSPVSNVSNSNLSTRNNNNLSTRTIHNNNLSSPSPSISNNNNTPNTNNVRSTITIPLTISSTTDSPILSLSERMALLSTQKEKKVEKTWDGQTNRDANQTLLDATKLLGIDNWEVFKNIKIKVLNLKTGFPKKKEVLMDAVVTAAKIVDPCMVKFSIVNDSRPQENMAGMAKSAQLETSLSTVLTKLDLNWKSPLYWYVKGYLISRMPQGSAIRCDGSAALAFYLLYESGFSGRIALIKQGDPRTRGHWFLLCGAAEDSVKTSSILKESESPCFVVDLWGASITGELTTAHWPPRCVGMGPCDLEIVWLI